ncbi:OmpH family outer membrane protein [Gemmobacter lanyuensis]|uniref:OmpH family outer membrane protein n=1 Tax=Gemmobacter lanyuensis TaxID=1054497 RepID=UPI001672B95B|nr:OmpH family outer membrane protein [Gemmobacter lanyuensis]
MSILSTLPALAQEPAAAAAAPGAALAGVHSQIAVIEQDQLYMRTRYGQAMQARSDAARRALQAENQKLEAALEAEERDLTNRRAAMTPEEFRPLSEDFNEKVKGIRAAQDTKARSLTTQMEEDRGRFREVAGPVLAELLRELGAVVLIDKSTVVLSLDAIDITDRAIAKIDAVLGDGATPAAPTPKP